MARTIKGETERQGQIKAKKHTTRKGKKKRKGES
jgi:hypothetical protein